MGYCCLSPWYCWHSWCCFATISEVPFELAVAGGPAVICFPAVYGILAVASISAHFGVPILAGGFTYWTVQCDILQDYRIIGL